VKAQNTDFQVVAVSPIPFNMSVGDEGDIYIDVQNSGEAIPINGVQVQISISRHLQVPLPVIFSDNNCNGTGSIWSVTWTEIVNGNTEVVMKNTLGVMGDGASCSLQVHFLAVTKSCNKCGIVTCNSTLTFESGLGELEPGNNSNTGKFTVNDAPLPIKLGDFSAKVNDCSSIDILWDTYSEENFDRAEVQKSVDGKNFKTIGTVKSKGNGISVHNSYVFTDRSPLVSGTVYYRLKAIDLDNAFSYSKLATAIADCDGVLDMNIYPNPTQGTANVTFKGFKNKTECNVILLNVKGEVVKDYKMDPLTNNFLNVNDLPSGVYFLKLIDDSVSLQKKFVKIN